MAHAAELAAIVASYLRRHGFSKTHAAFLGENGGAIAKEISCVDLETLYTNYTATQPNGDSVKMKSKKAKYAEDDSTEKRKIEDTTTDEGKASASAKKKHVKKQEVVETEHDTEMADVEGDKVESKKKSKKEKKEKHTQEDGSNAAAPATDSEMADAEESTREPVDNGKLESKKSKKEKKEKHTNEDESNVVAPTTEAESAGVEKESSKKKKKHKNVKESVSPQNGSKGQVLIENTTNTPSKEDGSSKKKKSKVEEEQSNVDTDDGTSKKKRKKSKLSDGENEKENNESTPVVDVASEANGCESNSKKKKKKQKNEATDVNDNVQENVDQKENKDTSENEEKLQSHGQADNGAAEQTPGSNGKKKKDTPGKNKTPTGALAFKRVDPETISFKDPRLQDNSYWAKDGAEEGYGAKAQEVLGLVRGRDFRHEKTKKKRGSYRGGQIGLESHSIKFENSDDEE